MVAAKLTGVEPEQESVGASRHRSAQPWLEVGPGVTHQMGEPVRLRSTDPAAQAREMVVTATQIIILRRAASDLLGEALVDEPFSVP
jgi:hypothetical protein